jgi:16S rRNA (cytosine1402-N4)-methyltransferase
MPIEKSSSPAHQSVLYQETIDALRPKSAGRYLDGTLGAGGHSIGILEASQPGGQLLGLDIDSEALSIATERLSAFGERARLVKGSYAEMTDICHEHNFLPLDGILLDVGASSIQFDRAERGFSFRNEGPLDMRFDLQASTSADDLVNHWPEEELANLIYRFGEERASRRIAKAIVKARPISTTKELAKVIAANVRNKRGGIHPATRSFQALRIAVNEELDTLEKALPQAIELLAPQGRLAVIAFHSLEDRIVKQFMRRESQDCICPPEQLICTCGHTASIKEIVRRPIRPQESEVSVNPRARSARLRVAEKL